MKKPIISFIAVFFLYMGVFAQYLKEEHELTIQSNTIVTSGNEIPFWLQMNQLGAVDGSGQSQQLFLLDWNRKPMRALPNEIQLTYGMNVLGRLSDHSVFSLNEYWGRLNFKNWYFHAGAKGEPIFANGLSLSNGNLFLSNNARPLPRLEFGTENSKPFKNGWLNNFAFDFLYSEFLLLDDRYVEDAHLHHKKLNIIYSLAPQWTVSVGFDHWVFWGGTFPGNGDIPAQELPGFEDYLRYIFGWSGSSGAPETDQNNVSGNQLGQYLVDLTHSNDNFQLKFYWQHLWEDRSGMELQNIADGFWGILWQRKSPAQLLESMLVEYADTRDQSGSYHMEPHPNDPDRLTGRGRDNYFNNSVYRSGFVSYGRMMGVPLFIPTIENGVSIGFTNTRLWAIHHGMNGWLTEDLSWKTLVSYSRHYGQHGYEYPSPKRLLSMAAQFGYKLPKKPITCSFRLAYDNGTVLDSAFGAGFQLTYRID
jgi:hypothetical protein